MECFDVLIVGGGPAGSSCAWALRNSGLRVAIIDKARFPRDKPCGGWITPQVLADLRIDPAAYACAHTLQPITGFRTSVLPAPPSRGREEEVGRPSELETRYGAIISYGVRRCEFDSFLLARSGAKVFEGVDPSPISRSGGLWMIADRFEAPLLVGAAGHFCPVARVMGAHPPREAAVLAQEAEFELPPAEAALCRIRGETPELYFCPDMKGYGWCFRKGNYLNVGFGTLQGHGIPLQVSAFLQFLYKTGKIASPVHAKPRGHAYLLYGPRSRTMVGDAILLLGDAAGLAYAQSGEGIRPAVESGLLAARCILAARGDYARQNLMPYRDLLQQRFGGTRASRLHSFAGRLPQRALCFVVRHAINQPWFTRSVLLDRWFLHRGGAALGM